MKKSTLKKLITLGLFYGGVAFLTYRMNKKEAAELAVDNLDLTDELGAEANLYERCIKRAIDIIVAGAGLIVAVPVIAVFSVIIFIEDPGNPIFVQKRVGTNSTYFNIHKLRSMKKNTSTS